MGLLAAAAVVNRLAHENRLPCFPGGGSGADGTDDPEAGSQPARWGSRPEAQADGAGFFARRSTLDNGLNVILSRRLQNFFPQPARGQNFIPFTGQPIRFPEKLAPPDTAFLCFHREHLWVG